MIKLFSIETIILLASIIFSIVLIIVFLLKGKRTSVFYSHLCCQILILIWLTGQIFDVFAADEQLKWLIKIYMFFAVCFISLSWLIFSLLFTKHILIRNKPFLTIVFLLPVFLYIGLLTNQYHHLFFFNNSHSQYIGGPLYWGHVLESYLYLAVGTGILIKYSGNSGYSRKQAVLLAFAALIPMVLNIIFVWNIINMNIDLTPVSFFVSLALFTLATFRYRFLDVMPIAMRKVVDSVSEAIIVVDFSNKIIDSNRAFHNNFSKVCDVNDCDITVFVQKISKYIVKTEDTDRILNAVEKGEDRKISGELTVLYPEKRHYAVHIQPIITDKQVALGRVVSFNDMTSFYTLMEQLNLKNQELREKNQQLADYAETVEELAVVKERNRFARDVHDTLGHTMTVLIALLEVCGVTCRKDVDETEEKLANAARIARDGLAELRRSIKGIASGNLENKSIIDAVKDLVEQVKQSGVNIDFTFQGTETNVDQARKDAIYRFCQEALTNAVRHGNAEYITIILMFNPDRIKTYVFDDGCGCTNIKKGLGLTGMEQRVKEFNGVVSYGSDGEKGFNIRMEIPLKGMYKND